MTVEERKELAELLANVCLTFNREPSEGMIAMYVLALNDLPFADVKPAILKTAQTSKFMPVPAEIREMTGGVSAADRPGLAWAAVKRAVRLHGGYQSVDFDDALINAAIRMMGGWNRFCETPGGDAFDTWLRRDFVAMYATLCRSGISGEMLEPLPGIVATENGGSGYLEHVPTPVVIETGLPIGPQHRRIGADKPRKIGHHHAAVAGLAANLGTEK